MPLAICSGLRSLRMTGNLRALSHWAMPAPITPEPITAVCVIGLYSTLDGARAGGSGSEETDVTEPFRWAAVVLGAAIGVAFPNSVATISAVPSGLELAGHGFPTLKLWAILACPSGTNSG